MCTCGGSMDSQTVEWILTKPADIILGCLLWFFTKKIFQNVTLGGGKRIFNFPFKKASKTVAQCLKHKSIKLKSVVQTWTSLIFFLPFFISPPPPPFFYFLPIFPSFLPPTPFFLPNFLLSFFPVPFQNRTRHKY